MLPKTVKCFLICSAVESEEQWPFPCSTGDSLNCLDSVKYKWVVSVNI